ncbi:MAG: M20/M25/M40 family metallo-hydrolase [Propioniciclava sp.]
MTAASAGGTEATLTENLRRLIACPTVADRDPALTDPAPFTALHSTLAELYPHLHDTCELTPVGAHGLLFCWRGTTDHDAPLVLMAHQDVVPADQDWTSPPFAATVVGGHLVGRGAVDDKGALLAVCEAVEGLIARGHRPRRDVWLLFSADEEVDGGSAREAATLLRRRGIVPWLVLDEGGAVIDPGAVPGVGVPAAMIGIAEKGTLTLRLSTVDEGGHSSVPRRGGATARIARAVGRLDRTTFPAHLDTPTRAMLLTLGRHARGGYQALYARTDTWAPVIAEILARISPETAATVRTTIAVTQLEGSPAANVLPTRAAATVNVRLSATTTVAAALARLSRAVADRSITAEIIEATEASAVSTVDDDRWALLVKVAGEAFPDAVAAPYTQNGATDSRHFARWCRHVYRFAPLRMSDEDRGRIHGADERVSTATLAEGVHFMTRLIEGATT